jgi:hypothetical protein
LVAHHSADADPAGLGQRLQSCCDVHAVTEDVLVLGNHVAEVDPEPELDPRRRRDSRVAIRHAPLHFHPASDGIDHARELRQEAVASVLDDAAAVLRDLGIDQHTEMSFEPLVRPLFIRPHQARIPRHVGGEDSGEAADRGHLSRGVRGLYQVYLETHGDPNPALDGVAPEKVWTDRDRLSSVGEIPESPPKEAVASKMRLIGYNNLTLNLVNTV